VSSLQDLFIMLSFVPRVETRGYYMAVPDRTPGLASLEKLLMETGLNQC